MSKISKHPTASIVMAFSACMCGAISFVMLVAGKVDLLYGFLMLALFSLILALAAKKRINVTRELAMAYILRLGICLLYTAQNDGDADGYAVNALRYAAMPMDELFMNIPTGAYLYSWIISFFFRIFGPCYMPVRAMNMAVSVWCVIIAVDIASLLYHNEKTVKITALCMALFPNLIRFSSYFANREPLLLLFTLLYIKYSYKYYSSNRMRNLLLSIVCLIPAMILHTSMIAMMVLTMMIIVTRTSNGRNKMSILAGKVFLLVATVIAFAYMLLNGIGTEKFDIAGGVELSVSGISSIGNMSAAGRAAYLSEVSFSNPILTVLFLPVRMAYFLYTPFVWMVRSAVDILGLFDATLYLWISIIMLKKVKALSSHRQKTKEEKFIFFMLLVLIVMIAMFGAVTSNYGTAIRHRCKLFALFLLISADNINIPFKTKNR